MTTQQLCMTLQGKMNRSSLLQMLLLGCLSVFSAACGETVAPAGTDAAATDGDDVAAVEDVLTPAEEVTATEDVVEVPDIPEVKIYAGKCKAGPAICDDSNPCTVDDCDEQIGCTNLVKVCADKDICTQDSCDVATGNCTHNPVTCDDDNACTDGKCVAIEGCVFTALDCNDGNACTADGCTPSSGCQSSEVNCDDGYDCSTDFCDQVKGCVHDKPLGVTCCNDPSDCDDGNVCTTNSCSGGICKSVGVIECCTKNADCEDNNACTVDACNLGNGKCSNDYAPGAGCCKADVDCNDKEDCSLDKCFANQCVHEATCCKTADDCKKFAGVADACAEPVCTNGVCAVATPALDSKCCGLALPSTSFEDADKWAVNFSGGSAGGWAISKTAGSSQTGVAGLVYKGVSPPQSYNGATARAKFSEVSLPLAQGVQLKFKAYVFLSSGDMLRLRAVTAEGSWQIWSSNTNGTWQPVTINLSGLAARFPTHKVRFVFELVPQKFTANTQVKIDDFTLTSTCSTVNCVGDGQCDDNLSATDESCVAGKCVYKPGKNYCELGDSCDDSNLCTNDSCTAFFAKCNHNPVGNCCLKSDSCDDKKVCSTDFCPADGASCVHTQIPAAQCCDTVADCDDKNLCTTDLCPVVGMGCAHTQTDLNCCTTVADCNDKDACTIDSCVTNQCGHKNNCCKVDLDCEDGDLICTADTCVGGFCQSKPTGDPSCCTPEVFKYDFESDLPAFFTLSGGLGGVKWQAMKSKEAHGGNGALWYGNVATGNYDANGQTTLGTVATQPVDLPKGETVEVAFWVWMDTETGGFDVLTFNVKASIGGNAKTYKLWDKSQVGNFNMMQWTEIKLNLSAFAGNKVTFEWVFDTKDGIANQTSGVYLDDISLKRSCGPALCATKDDCNDKLPLISSFGCVGGKCLWVVN